jgi:UDP-N-acetylglucosamine 4,6-dehydratase
MQKILITGITGTVAKAFIKEFYNSYEIHGVSRNDSSQQILSYSFPKVKSYLCDICDMEKLATIFEKIRPEIVIHAGAIKHIDLAEDNPVQTCNVNIIGSLNIIALCTKYNVANTVAISTDKACDATNVYGMSKFLMEKCFLSSSGKDVKFCCTRFANVAGSSGSVIPKWNELRKKGLPLTVTDINMSRLMFSPREASFLIQKAIELSKSNYDPFVLTKKMKTLKIYDLAMCLSDKVDVVGIRKGEKLFENLVSEKELPFTEIIEDDYVLIRNSQTPVDKRLNTVINSLTAEEMNKDQIKNLLVDCGVNLED